MELTCTPYSVALLIAIMVVCVKTKKLTIPGSFLAAVIGLLVFQAAQLKGITMLLAFFITAVLATSHKKYLKAKLHSSNFIEKRNAGQVFANGGVAGLTAILTITDPQHSKIYLLMMAASLASALADCLSSELGMVYGKQFYNILTFKKDKNGLDGVVSVEGLLIGTVGAAFIAFIFSGFSHQAFLVILAGTFGNLADSFLGATMERKQFIGNNAVNFLNTFLAALVAAILYALT